MFSKLIFWRFSKYNLGMSALMRLFDRLISVSEGSLQWVASLTEMILLS